MDLALKPSAAKYVGRASCADNVFQDANFLPKNLPVGRPHVVGVEEGLVTAVEQHLAGAARADTAAGARRILRRALLLTDQAPSARRGAPSPAVHVAKATAQLSLSEVAVTLGHRAEAIAEARVALQSTDLAWRGTLLMARAGPDEPQHEEPEASDPSSMAPGAYAALRQLLQDPPWWLDRAIGLAIQARLQLARELGAVGDAGVDLEAAKAAEESEAVFREASMLAHSFLPPGHGLREEALSAASGHAPPPAGSGAAAAKATPPALSAPAARAT